MAYYRDIKNNGDKYRPGPISRPRNGAVLDLDTGLHYLGTKARHKMTTQTQTMKTQTQSDDTAETMDIVIVSPELSRDSMSDEDYARACQQLEDCYTALETDTPYCVRVRKARSGEAPGTYVRQASGNLQILGYSIEMPEDLHDLSAAAWEKFCNLPL